MFEHANGSRTPASMKLALVAGAVALVNASCAVESPDVERSEENVDATSSAIVGGKMTTDYPAVGMLTRNGSSFCTGTVVAKRVVVSAGHCLSGVSAPSIRFALGSSAESAETVLELARVVVHPEYDAQQIKNDIAVLVLSQDAPVTPIAINDAMSSSWIGRSLTFVGFGVTNGMTSTGNGVKRVVSIPVTEVANQKFTYKGAMRNTCYGDSGGPAFAQDSAGNLLLAGVTSYGDRSCMQYGVDTRVDAYKSFIAAAQQ
jgi:secreted trypsin-like serine protease